MAGRILLVDSTALPFRATLSHCSLHNALAVALAPNRTASALYPTAGASAFSSVWAFSRRPYRAAFRPCSAPMGEHEGAASPASASCLASAWLGAGAAAASPGSAAHPLPTRL